MLNDYKLLQEKREEKILAIKVEPKRSNKIIYGILYNQDLINRVKSISGRRWNQEEKYWEIHSLRYSFATHLLEVGTDLRYIQELLSPKSSKITEIYTHVSKKKLSTIKNPLDTILKGDEI
ncbi:tyrosine-type recombinase/integrase [bacterium]|nr:tyrosine-type recombinase/integrase [bacterium]